LDDYLEWCIEQQEGHREQIEAERRWESALWHLTRLLKAHPDLEGLPAQQALKEIETVMRGWASQTGVPDPWEHRLGLARESAHGGLLDTWEKGRYVPGLGPLENACEQARACPLRLPREVGERRSAGYPAFVSLAGWLQVGMGARPILLPVEKVA